MINPFVPEHFTSSREQLINETEALLSKLEDFETPVLIHLHASFTPSASKLRLEDARSELAEQLRCYRDSLRSFSDYSEESTSVILARMIEDINATIASISEPDADDQLEQVKSSAHAQGFIEECRSRLTGFSSELPEPSAFEDQLSSQAELRAFEQHSPEMRSIYRSLSEMSYDGIVSQGIRLADCLAAELEGGSYSRAIARRVAKGRLDGSATLGEATDEAHIDVLRPYLVKLDTLVFDAGVMSDTYETLMRQIKNDSEEVDDLPDSEEVDDMPGGNYRTGEFGALPQLGY